MKEINARIQDSQRIHLDDSEFEAKEKEKTIYKKIQGRESYEGKRGGLYQTNQTIEQTNQYENLNTGT